MWGRKHAARLIAAADATTAGWKQMYETAAKRASHNHELWTQANGDAAKWHAEALNLRAEVEQLYAGLLAIYALPPAPTGLIEGQCPACNCHAEHDAFGCTRSNCHCPRVPWLASLGKEVAA